jgi:hypothetical protein
MGWLSKQKLGLFTRLATTYEAMATPGLARLRSFRVLGRDSQGRRMLHSLALKACNKAGFADPVITELAILITGAGAVEGQCHIDADLPHLYSGIVGLTGSRGVWFEELERSVGVGVGEALHFPSQLRHLGVKDARELDTQLLTQLHDEETLGSRPGFWAAALHYYVYERSRMPGTIEEIAAAVKQTKSCAFLDEVGI